MATDKQIASARYLRDTLTPLTNTELAAVIDREHSISDVVTSIALTARKAGSEGKRARANLARKAPACARLIVKRGDNDRAAIARRWVKRQHELAAMTDHDMAALSISAANRLLDELQSLRTPEAR